MDSIGSPLFRSMSMTLEIPPKRKMGWQTSMPPHLGVDDHREPIESSPRCVRCHRFDREVKVNLPQRLSRPPTNEEENQRQDGRWVWKLGSVSPLPMFYPIQEWNTLKIDNLSLDTITARISEFLRLHSIETIYEKRDGYVRCRASSGVEFSINIWQEPSGKSSTAFLVNFQHISGCTMQFYHIQSKLWNDILGLGQTKLKQQKQNCYIVEKFPSTISQDEEMYHATVVDDTYELLSESPLRRCREMLKSRMLSENQLGLESLAILTDRTKTVPKAVEEACFAVSHDPEMQSVLKKYLSRTPEEDGDAYYHYERNHILSLQILAQSLLRSRDGKRGTAYNNWSDNKLFWESVLKVLLSDIRQATVKPLEATLSAQCLVQLVENNTDQFRSTLVGEDLMSDLELYARNAHQFGIQRNASLEYETKHLLRSLEGTKA